MTKFEIGAVKIRNYLNRVFPGTKNDYFCSAIVTAAGSGTRMGGVSKQLMELNGIPCIVYSLFAFQKNSEIQEIIITAKKEETEVLQNLCNHYGINKVTKIVVGGETRQESVKAGFLSVSPKCDIVAIHDAARPLITSEQISELIASCKRYGAVCAAKKIFDTVKRADQNDLIVETVPRDKLFSVQTPQVFKSDLYRVSLALAEKSGYSVTDDASLAEKAGFPVKLLELGGLNIKLTMKDDVEIITSMLKENNHESIQNR